MAVVAVAVFVGQTAVPQSQLAVEGITYSEVILVVVVVVVVIVVVVVTVVVGVVVVVVVVVGVVVVVVVVVVVDASVVEVVEVFKVVVDIIDEVMTVVLVVGLSLMCPDLMASQCHFFVVEKISKDFSHTNFDLYNRSRLFLPSGQLTQELHVDQAVRTNQEAQAAPSDIEWHSYCYC